MNALNNKVSDAYITMKSNDIYSIGLAYINIQIHHICCGIFGISIPAVVYSRP
jgi:hypothetical protein